MAIFPLVLNGTSRRHNVWADFGHFAGTHRHGQLGQERFRHGSRVDETDRTLARYAVSRIYGKTPSVDPKR